jgi:hypothetical protein
VVRLKWKMWCVCNRDGASVELVRLDWSITVHHKTRAVIDIVIVALLIVGTCVK